MGNKSSQITECDAGADSAEPDCDPLATTETGRDLDALDPSQTPSGDLQRAFELLTAGRFASPHRAAAVAEFAVTRFIDISPRDPIEELLSVQLLTLHAATLHCVERASAEGQPGSTRREELSLAMRMSRTCAQIAETIAKGRRGGKQSVKVEHVHVNAGGQAIVGSVERKGGAKGAIRNS